MLNSPSLQALLAEIWKKSPESERTFFEVLLESNIYVPLVKNEPLISISEGEPTIPIFSDSGFVGTWAGKEIEFEEKLFRSFIWVVPDKHWLHLDPGQEFGRALSPWDCSQLKNAPGGLEELLANSGPEIDSELEILIPGDQYKKLLARLSIAIEAYAQVDEASCVLISRNGGLDLSPVIDINHSEMSEEILGRLVVEIEEVFLTFQKNSDEEGLLKNVVICTDGRIQGSPNFGVFSEINPFFIRQRELH